MEKAKQHVLGGEEMFGLAEKQEIDKIAWQVFLRNTRLRFKRELTSNEINSILDKEGNEYFREEAVKIYQKKLRALQNKKYPVIDVPASGKSGWGGGAFTLCFVYSKYNGNFVLRGYYKEVTEYLRKNYTHYFCNKSLWYKGFNRDIWDFWKENIGIFKPDRTGRRKENKFMVRPYGGNFTGREISKEEMKEKTFKFKRMPKRWIPEFDLL